MPGISGGVYHRHCHFGPSPTKLFPVKSPKTGTAVDIRAVDEVSRRNVEAIGRIQKEAEGHRTAGEMVADAFAQAVGSWMFIIIQADESLRTKRLGAHAKGQLHENVGCALMAMECGGRFSRGSRSFLSSTLPKLRFVGS